MTADLLLAADWSVKGNGTKPPRNDPRVGFSSSSCPTRGQIVPVGGNRFGDERLKGLHGDLVPMGRQMTCFIEGQLVEAEPRRAVAIPEIDNRDALEQRSATESSEESSRVGVVVPIGVDDH